MRLYGILLLAIVLPVCAQDPQPALSCNDNNHQDNKYRECQMKESTIPASGRVSIDSGTNGGVQVKGWSRSDVQVRARVETWAPTESEAKGMQSQVNIQTAGGQIRATAPDFGRDRGYSVTFEVFVPQRTDVSAKAHNGGIGIQDVRGRIEFDTTNGGVKLARLAGAVKGKTVNGGVTVELTGTSWDGEQLDVATTNGGVSLQAPSNYSARLETSTVNGGFHSELDGTVTGNIGKNMTMTLGSGGPLIKVTTVNGGIHIKKS
jgi:DUF4097 and DUF4098 domain-containing protein YvlB